MSSRQRYGIFRVGRRWRLACDDSTSLDFVALTDALAAADVLVRAHEACGDICEVVVQDRNGRLISLPGAGHIGLGLIAEEILAEDFGPAEPTRWAVGRIGSFAGTA
ncbi:MAG TPA: hypothetical protein VGH86_03275 [Phenylobacterium sp.]|jgi:hypothetical protein